MSNYVTKEGLKKLQEELDRLQNVERPKISKAIGQNRTVERHHCQ